MTARFTPSSFLLAQETHLALGAVIVLLFQALHLSWVGAVFLIAAIELPKEFLIDTALEGASLEDGAVDMAFWFVGAGLAYLVIAGFGLLDIPIVFGLALILLAENSVQTRGKASPG